MADPKKKGDADESPFSPPTVEQTPSVSEPPTQEQEPEKNHEPKLVGYELKRNFGFNHLQRSHFWAAGTIFRLGKDDVNITLLHQKGAVFTPIIE